MFGMERASKPFSSAGATASATMASAGAVRVAGAGETGPVPHHRVREAVLGGGGGAGKLLVGEEVPQLGAVPAARPRFGPGRHVQSLRPGRPAPADLAEEHRCGFWETVGT